MPAGSRSGAWARRIIRLTAPLVPRRERDDWRAEWLAEIAAQLDQHPVAVGPSALQRALGAPIEPGSSVVPGVAEDFPGG